MADALTKNGSRTWARAPVETVLMAAVGLLCALSVLMVFSASSVTSQNDYGNTWNIVMLHGISVAVGLVLALIASRIPLRIWRDRLGPALLVLSFLLLILVRLPGMPWSEGVGGATRWIKLGPLSFQPSEIAKIAMILWLARLLTVHQDLPSRDLLKRALLVFIPLVGLVFLGDDLGTVVLLGIVFVAMLWLGGLPTRDVAMTLGGMFGVATVALFAFEGFRLQRVQAFLSQDQFAESSNYQLNQSKISFAAGGITGQGPGGSRAKWGFLPEAHTDFILAVTGEELGVGGVLLTIGCLAAVVVCAGMIGMQSRDRFGQLVAWGIACWIVLQAGINVSTTVGAMPTKGIPLPFMSYGGSAMTTALVAVGILLAVSRAQNSAPARRATGRRRAR